MKKMLIVLTLIFALLTTCFIGCDAIPDNSADNSDSDATALKANAAAVFTLDVNPGVRIYVKEDNTVITVEATNEDGEEVVAELDLEGIDYETVVEKIIDEMDEKGYLEGDESSVLISVEKKAMDISEKVNEKINEAFEKHGKKASVIEQELDKLDEEINKTIGEMAKKYNISEGKAHLIEKIREEFPELSEEELATLKVNDLGMMLEDTSDDVKDHFKKIGKAVEDAYIGREEALDVALADLEIALENITMQRVRVTKGEDKMLYEVEFVYDGMEYEITVDAKTGEILSSESEMFEEFDASEFINDFCDKNNISPDDIKNQIINDFFDKGENNGEHGEEKILTRGEILKSVMASLGISEDTLKKTDVKLHETENGAICSVMIELENGDTYKIVVEAYNGAVLKVEFNGITVEIPTNSAE